MVSDREPPLPVVGQLPLLCRRRPLLAPRLSWLGDNRDVIAD